MRQRYFKSILLYFYKIGHFLTFPACLNPNNFFQFELEQFFHTVGQNNFGNKIPFLSITDGKIREKSVKICYKTIVEYRS